MKILTAEQIRAADAYTIAHEPVASIDLMERAAGCCFQWIYDRAPDLFPPGMDEREFCFIVFCGPGNNGGDGLVIARMLARNGYEVKVYILGSAFSFSNDFQVNHARLSKTKIPVFTVESAEDIPEIPDEATVIDAIFGTGLSRPVEGLMLDVIRAINQSSAKVISIDMPSGLFDLDNTGNQSDGIVKASYTLTFQCLKPAMLFPENASFVGTAAILNIGLHPEFLHNVETRYYLIEEAMACSLYKCRGKFSHKGTFGHLAVFAGGKGKTGAAVLCAKAAIRSGVGLVTAFVNDFEAPIMHTAAPEIMVADRVFQNPDFESRLQSYTSIAAGPGIGTGDETKKWFKSLLSAARVPLVIDADALNILASDNALLSLIPERSILTPHPGEFKRLVGSWEGDYEKLEKQIEFADKYNVIVVLKGAHTTIVSPEGQVFFNSSGNPGMATAGSGDVLTGIIGALLAAGYDSLEAAILGVFLHGKSGDIAEEAEGQESLIASDLISNLGKAFLSLNLPSQLR